MSCKQKEKILSSKLDLEVLRPFIAYAKGEEHLDFCDENFTKNIVNYALVNGSDAIREQLVLSSIGADSVDGKHGWDGKLKKRMVEVKCETVANATNRVSGKGTFNNLTWKSFQKYKAGGIYLNAGFDKEGRVLYIIAFDIRDIFDDMERHLLEHIGETDRVRTNTMYHVTPSNMPVDFEVVYLPKIIDTTKYVRPFLKQLTRNYFENVRVGRRPLVTQEWR